LGGGMWSMLRFYSADSLTLDGFYANHNAQADLLLIGMVALTAVLVDWVALGMLRRPVQAVVGAGMLAIMFVCAIILTASRTGMALIPLALAGQVAILWPLLALSRRGLMLSAAGVLLAVAGAGVAVESNTALSGAVSRFRQSDPIRPEIWRNTLYAIEAHLPWGSGMGTFMPVYTSIEKLETVTDQLVNRAHDDYLEFALEGGIPAIVIMVIVVGCLAWWAWPWRSDNHLALRSQRICASVGLLVVGLHSIVDYPLRAMSLACIAGLLAGLLFPARANLVPASQGPLGEVKESL
jgi:exopolysaccharide production protein ExoQ